MRFQSLQRLFVRSASKSAIDCPSTPAAPWLAFTFLKASQTSRLGMSNGFTSSTGSSCCQLASVGRGSRLNNAAPSVQLHYRAFIPNTSCSVPVRRIGTLVLAVLAACDLSLCIGAQVLTFHTRAWLSFAPPTCRMPLGQASGLPRTDPGGRVTPRFWHRLTRFRHFIDGLLTLASLNRACRNLVPAFPQRSPPSLLTTAACGGLRSTPDCRPRRTYLHLSYSCAAPCGPAILVTQDPSRTLAVYFCGDAKRLFGLPVW